MTDTKHTPTPWQIEGECRWISTMHPFPIFAIEGIVGSREQHIADANHIVKCVNMHDELVEAFSSLFNWLMKYNGEKEHAESTDEEVEADFKMLMRCQETLKKAGAL